MSLRPKEDTSVVIDDGRGAHARHDGVGPALARRIDRLVLAEGTHGWASLLIGAAQAAHLTDPVVRSTVTSALFSFVDRVVADESLRGSVWEAPLYAAFWRACSMIRQDEYGRLGKYLDPLLTRQACLQVLFEHNQWCYPTGSGMVPLRVKVAAIAAEVLTEGFLGEWHGAETAMAGCAYLAALAVECPEADELTARFLRLRRAHPDGSVSTLLGYNVRKLYGLPELCRPDMRARLIELTAFAAERSIELPGRASVAEVRARAAAACEEYGWESMGPIPDQVGT